jgi:phosphoserine phosphatase RsbU/P
MPLPAADARPVTVLLVDDQAFIGETVRRLLADETDIRFHFCPDPARAIATANEVQPTVILQDLVMPEIDGLLLVKFFRANPATRQTPMIVLSSKEEPIVKAKAFALGANDYLVKLPDKVELIARIRYHSAGYIHLLERDEAHRELAESQRLLAEEVAQAAKYVQSLLPTPLVGPVRIDWKFVPSTQLAGDMFGYHWIDADHLAIYLLDVSGHGVGSALLAVSAANLLAAQSLPNADCRDPGQVLTRLNDVFPMEKQNDKYFTIWYGVYRPADRTLAYSNAGHPAPLLFTGPPGRRQLQELESVGPAVGVCPDLPFDAVTTPVPAGARLLVYSDGVFEIERPDGSMWTYREFVEYATGLLVADGPVIDRALAFVRDQHAGDVLGDDFSMLDVRF